MNQLLTSIAILLISINGLLHSYRINNLQTEVNNLRQQIERVK